MKPPQALSLRPRSSSWNVVRSDSRVASARFRREANGLETVKRTVREAVPCGSGAFAAASTRQNCGRQQVVRQCLAAVRRLGYDGLGAEALGVPWPGELTSRRLPGQEPFSAGRFGDRSTRSGSQSTDRYGSHLFQRVIARAPEVASTPSALSGRHTLARSYGRQLFG